MHLIEDIIFIVRFNKAVHTETCPDIRGLVYFKTLLRGQILSGYFKLEVIWLCTSVTHEYVALYPAYTVSNPLLLDSGMQAQLQCEDIVCSPAFSLRDQAASSITKATDALKGRSAICWDLARLEK